MAEIFAAEATTALINFGKTSRRVKTDVRKRGIKSIPVGVGFRVAIHKQ